MISKWGMQVRYKGSMWQHELIVEAMSPAEALRIVQAQHNGITILGQPYPIR